MKYCKLDEKYFSFQCKFFNAPPQNFDRHILCFAVVFLISLSRACECEHTYVLVWHTFSIRSYFSFRWLRVGVQVCECAVFISMWQPAAKAKLYHIDNLFYPLYLSYSVCPSLHVFHLIFIHSFMFVRSFVHSFTFRIIIIAHSYCSRRCCCYCLRILRINFVFPILCLSVALSLSFSHFCTFVLAFHPGL